MTPYNYAQRRGSSRRSPPSALKRKKSVPSEEKTKAPPDTVIDGSRNAKILRAVTSIVNLLQKEQIRVSEVLPFLTLLGGGATLHTKERSTRSQRSTRELVKQAFTVEPPPRPSNPKKGDVWNGLVYNGKSWCQRKGTGFARKPPPHGNRNPHKRLKNAKRKLSYAKKAYLSTAGESKDARILAYGAYYKHWNRCQDLGGRSQLLKAPPGFTN